MGGHMSNQNVLVSESFVAHFARKRRLLVALKPHVPPQIVEVFVAGDALTTTVTSVLCDSIVLIERSRTI